LLDSAPELASSENALQHGFWLQMQFNFINHNISLFFIKDLQLLLSGHSGALYMREIASSNPTCALLP
jgi:hypothetical protein